MVLTSIGTSSKNYAYLHFLMVYVFFESFTVLHNYFSAKHII